MPSIQDHLLSNEEIQADFVGDEWAWIATDRRLIKYRRSDSGAEQLSDLSYDEIAGVDVGHSERSQWLLFFALISGAGGFAIGVLSSPVIVLIGLVVAALLVYSWLHSEESFFEFRGRLAGDDASKWRIDRTNVEDTDELNDLVRAVREQVV